MKKHYYNGASLEGVLSLLEDRYGLSSEKFYEALVSGDALPEMPGFHRHVWASFYREALELRGEHEFAAHAERVLELA